MKDSTFGYALQSLKNGFKWLASQTDMLAEDWEIV